MANPASDSSEGIEFMSGTTVSHRGDTAKKLAVAGALLAAGVALIGRGAFSSWTSAVAGGPQAVTTGTVNIALGVTGAATNRLNVNATGIAPGDTIQRSVDLSNGGTINLASITLGMSVTGTSTVLDSDASNGLAVDVKSCTVPWTEAGTSPAFTYTCGGGGTQATVLTSTPVATLKATPSSLGAVSSLTAAGRDHLVVTLTMPSAATIGQGLTSTLNFNFTGTQRAGQAG